MNSTYFTSLGGLPTIPEIEKRLDNHNLILETHEKQLALFLGVCKLITKGCEEMDKKIKEIEKTIKKDTKKEGKKLKSLEKADKKRDKTCDYGEMMMKKKKAKKK